jgi:hypothetical protein
MRGNEGIGKLETKKLMLILEVVTLFWLTAGWAAQPVESWPEFQKNSQGLYYYLESTNLQNFSCLFSTDSFIGFIKSQGDSNYTYPLKLIWMREGRIYYVLQPSEKLNDPGQRSQLLEKIQLTKNQFHGFYLDWLSFLISSPFADIPITAQVNFQRDTVDVHYFSQGGDSSANVRKVFLRSGRLLRVEVESDSEKVINYPRYEEVEGKWICLGWDSQIYLNQKISSGLSTRLELKKIRDFWMPSRADIIVQTIEKPDQKFRSILFLKEYELDLPLQELPQSTSTDDSSKLKQ